jgi:hypothetical protein
MPNTQSRSSQEDPLRMMEPDNSTRWAHDPIPNPVTAVGVLTLTTLTIAPPAYVEPTPVTSSPADQAPAMSVDWRAELKARYKAMPNTTWFRAAHEGRSLGESMKIS